MPDNISINKNGMLFYVGDDADSSSAIELKKDIAEINRELAKMNSDNYEQIGKEQELLEDIKILSDLAIEFKEENSIEESSTELCLQYIRRDKYNGSSWNLFAGTVNEDFVNFVSQSEKGQKISATGYFNEAKIYDSKNNATIDLAHLSAALNAELYCVRTNSFVNLKDFCGWSGDISTLIYQLLEYENNTDYTSEEHKAQLLSYTESLLGTDESTSTFGIEDLLSDIDAVIIYNENYIESDEMDFYTVIKNYYYTYNDSIKNRENKFVEYLSGTKGELYNYVDSYLNNNWLYVRIVGGINQQKYMTNYSYYNDIVAQAFSNWFEEY